MPALLRLPASGKRIMFVIDWSARQVEDNTRRQPSDVPWEGIFYIATSRDHALAIDACADMEWCAAC
jgi:hypothetical protein